MEQILDNLKKNDILSTKSVLAIKEYIFQKYPDYPSNRTSVIFADAVHKIIDRNIVYFSNQYRVKIKKNLLNQIIKKDTFGINAYEIFEACSLLNSDESYYIECLTTWINNNQSEYISKDKVVELSTILKEMLLNKSPSFEDHSVQIQRGSLYEDDILDYSLDTIPLQDVVFEEDPVTSSYCSKTYKPELTDLQNIRKSAKSIKQLFLEVVNKIRILVHSTKLRTLNFLQTYLKRNVVLVVIFLMIIAPISTAFIMLNNRLDQKAIPSNLDDQLLDSFVIHQSNFSEVTNDIVSDNQLQPHLQYKEINQVALKSWLTGRNSLLSEEPYFNSILNAAKEHNINPLLMFAITGQEQAFVPKSHEDATAIANNPFNVYGSWEDYNTDIDDTSTIAAKTILNLSEGCPENEDAIKWINQKYAEDENWHLGVTMILSQLEKVAHSD